MQRPSKRPARPDLKALAANLTEEQVEEGSAADQPFTPLDAFDRCEASLKERLATAEARATEAEEARAAAEAALEAARAGGWEGATTEAAAAFERTQKALRAAETELARYRDIAEKAEAEGSLAEFRYIDPVKIEDSLPADRFDAAYSAEEIAGLVADIRDRRQDSPILVRPKPGSSEGEAYEIAAGKRRLAACRQLGIPVLARIRSLTDREMLQARFGENHHRQDLSAFEKARYYEHSMRQLGLNAVQLAELYGIGRTVIQHHLSLNRVPVRVVNAFRNPSAVSHRTAKRLLDVLEQDPSAADRVVEALGQLAAGRARSDQAALEQEEITVAIAAALKREPTAPRRKGDGNLPIYVGKRKIATARLASGRWQLRFDKEVDQEFMERLTSRLPDLLEEIARESERDAQPRAA